MNTKNTLPEIQKGLEEIQEELKKFEGKNIPLTVLKKVSETFFYVLSTDITEETRNDIRKLQGKIQEEIQKKEKGKEKAKDMDREYFEKYAEEDYKVAEETIGEIKIYPETLKKEFQSQNGLITVSAYFYRLRKVFDLGKSPGEALNQWKELAGREIKSLFMDRAYFEQHARKDYEVVEKTIGEIKISQNTTFQERFKSQDGEVQIRTYLNRLKNAFDLKKSSTYREILNKWKELSGREIKAGNMDKEYFEQHAKEDYEAAEKIFKHIRCSRKILNRNFLSKAGEITLIMYLDTLKRKFSLEKRGEAVNKWKELAEIDIKEKILLKK